MPFYPQAFTGNAPARPGQNTRDFHFSGCDAAEPLDVFPQYSDALQHLINRPLPFFLLQDEAPPPVPAAHVQPEADALPNLRHSAYNHPRPHAVQQTQAPEVEDAFDIQLFINRIQPLNPDNPHYVAVEPLDSSSLHRYYTLGMTKPSAETRHAAELLAMGEDEFVLIDAVRAYVAFEMERHSDGADDSLHWAAPHPSAGNVPASAAVRCAAPEMDGVMEVQDFDNFQMITYTPVPAAHPLPPRYLQWLDGCGEPAEVESEFENQVVLCASNAEDAHSPGW